MNLAIAALFIATVMGVTAIFIRWSTDLGSDPAQRQRNRMIATLVLIGWLGLSGLLAALGVLSNFASTPPRIVPIILIANGAAIIIALSPLGKRLATQTPLVWLIGFQVFRVAVEIVLASLSHTGIVPVQMSFEGRNWDILTGLTAPLVAWLVAKGRISMWGVLLWNVCGLGLLINIVTIAMLSMPTPLRVFMNEPANTFIATFPYVWLPGLLVPAALFGHLLVFRAVRGLNR